jgi:hydroxymethylbilane synthase
LTEGQYGAIVLAIAGLKRLGLLGAIDAAVTPLEFDQMLPAPGQAVLVLETRECDSAARNLAGVLNDESTRLCATAERAFLGAFGGGCSVPVAAFATVHKGAIHLTGLVASPDGKRVLRGTATGGEPIEVARELFEQLAGQGALELFDRSPAMAGGAL